MADVANIADKLTGTKEEEPARPFFGALANYRRADAATHLAEPGDDEEQERLWAAREDALRRLMVTPAEIPAHIQVKFQTFQREVLEADGLGEYYDQRQHVWFAALMADAIALAKSVRDCARKRCERSGSPV